MTYLIVRYETLGNVAMTVPVIASLSARYKNHRFVVVSKKTLGDMFYGMENVLYYEVDKYANCHPNRLARSLYKDYHPDVVIDLQNSVKSNLLKLWLRFYGVESYSIDNGHMAKRMRCWLRWSKQEALPTEFQRYAQVFSEAQLEVDESFIGLPINAAARQRIQEHYGWLPQPWIGVAPFAKRKSNVLPYRLTKEVIQNLVQKGYHVFLFGAGQVECEILNQWADTFQHVTSVAGCLPLSDELELMRQLRVMLCMDSANQHLCSLVGLRAVTVWCGTHPSLGFLGWKQSANDVIQLENLSCRPCSAHGTNYCKFRNFACKNITFDTIIERINIH